MLSSLLTGCAASTVGASLLPNKVGHEGCSSLKELKAGFHWYQLAAAVTAARTDSCCLGLQKHLLHVSVHQGIMLLQQLD